ncbi:MAG: hypothetical protein ACREQ2_26515 [Candidatus Binatia bacterium]
MSSVTLTSLAMLKVNVDQGNDYLDYLRPFILQILVDHKPDPVTDRVVRDYIRTNFGLEIPERAVQVVLKRISKIYPLKKADGVYRITGNLPNLEIAAEKTKADRHIQAVLTGLIEFSKTTAKPVLATEDAVVAICAFLTKFNIPCLRAYLQGTAIPTVHGKHDNDIVLVSQYVLHVQRTDPERFESFMIMVQGHMLANALLCPDLQNAPKTYKGVTFYLDTPLLVQRLGLEGKSKEAASENLIGLLHNLGATVATFSHSHEELERVLRGAAAHVDDPAGHGSIVMEARRGDITKSDLLLMAGQIDGRLADAGIQVKDTPDYVVPFQIDEEAFEEVLDDEVSYFNSRAKEYDINSVRSIYVLRARTSPLTVEKSRAVLVTSNSGFARAAWEYGQRYEESREVSSVITDFSLANMAWLKAPLGAPSLPTTEVLSFSYAALQPSKELLGKYLTEIDRLEKQGKISERDHQLLRSSTLAQEELMRLTLGDEDAFTAETVTETLRRVTSEIRKEENEKVLHEQEPHRQTLDRLGAIATEKELLQKRIYWKCARKSRFCGWTASLALVIFLALGFMEGFGLKTTTPFLGWILVGGTVVLFLASIANLFYGTTVRQIHAAIQARFLTYFLQREAKATGIDFGANH